MIELAETLIGASRHFRDPSLAPNVGRASLGDTASGTHPLTVQGYTSLGDAASGMIPSMALERYTDPEDIAQDWFWTRSVRSSRDVDSVSDFSIPEFDSRSEYDRNFAEIGTRRDSAVAATQVGPSPCTLATLGSTQGVPRPSSDPSLVPLHFNMA